MTSWRNKHPVGFLNNGDETTAKALMNTIFTIKTVRRPLPGFESHMGNVHDRLSAGIDVDEVYPSIFIGDALVISLNKELIFLSVDGSYRQKFSGTARNKQYLKKLGITHVLNTAEGNRYGMVNTGRSYYKDTGMKYMGLQLLDLPTSDISAHFRETADFIEDGVKNGGKVLVHCLMGMSRSSTCVLAYLMLKQKMSATEAMRAVRLNRDIRPNDGFLHQLADLDNQLRRQREQSQSKNF